MSATYDPFGVLVSQSLSSGLSQSFVADAVGDTVSTQWSDSAGAVWLSDEQVSDVHGRWRSESLGGAEPGWSARSYGYDLAGRLTSVAESRDAGGDCQTRTYAFDVDSNRTGAAAFPADPTSGDCSTATATVWSQSFTVDAADRITSSGTAAGIGYDTWGRITALPAGLTSTPAAGAASAGYYANDLVRSLSQGGATRTWTLDPAGRLASMTTTGLGSTGLVNHYSDAAGDSPAWTVDTFSTGTATTRRYVAGFAGMLAEAAITGATTTTTVQLTGLHGDVLRTTSPTATGAPDGPGILTDEYGRVLDPDTGDLTTGPRYGWLGAQQRPTDTGTLGLTLMGVRLYAPLAGRFLSTDPVYGGNANAYTYPVDPVNKFDLDGRMRTAIGAYPERYWLYAKKLSGQARVMGVYFDRFGRQIPLRQGVWRFNSRRGAYSGWGFAKIAGQHQWNPWVENMIQVTLTIGKITQVSGNVERWDLRLPCTVPGGLRMFRVLIDTRTREADGLRRGILNVYTIGS